MHCKLGHLVGASRAARLSLAPAICGRLDSVSVLKRPECEVLRAAQPRVPCANVIPVFQVGTCRHPEWGALLV